MVYLESCRNGTDIAPARQISSICSPAGLPSNIALKVERREVHTVASPSVYVTVWETVTSDHVAAVIQSRISNKDSA